MRLKLVASTTFGLEAVTKREIEALGYEILSVTDGKVYFSGDERAIVRSNLWLRTSDRVGIVLNEFEATTSEELFQMIKGIPWEEWIPMDGNFIVNARTHKSELKSERVTQSVSEKALIEKLKETYPIEYFPKTGAKFDIKVTILKNMVTVTLDTTGESLHKRGYRKLISEAPIKETLASAMVLLSFYKEDRILLDPCCGSGTIPIEACMIAKNIAPGLLRDFSFTSWPIFDNNIFNEEKEIAKKKRKEIKTTIYGSDINKNMINIAKENAKVLGLENDIVFNVSDISKIRTSKEYGVIVTNPPYGKRIGDEKEISHIYDSYREFFKNNPTWSLFIITPDKTIESVLFNREADRRRKLYNGRLEVCYYQFHGEK